MSWHHKPSYSAGFETPGSYSARPMSNALSVGQLSSLDPASSTHNLTRTPSLPGSWSHAAWLSLWESGSLWTLPSSQFSAAMFLSSPPAPIERGTPLPIYFIIQVTGMVTVPRYGGRGPSGRHAFPALQLYSATGWDRNMDPGTGRTGMPMKRLSDDR
jgi:hypothetical protein